MDQTIIFADTIYGEARGEYCRPSGGLPSLIAVANVIMNRVKDPKRFGNTVEEVCLAKKQFSCWNDSDPNLLLLSLPTRFKEPIWCVALNVAQKVSDGLWPDLTKGSNHYHSTSITAPEWAAGVKPTIQIGAHIFYKI
ncbi:MAG: cell wall hydrolase [Alphaproteobacteria bacterium]|nr:cell wall hydrolase [Alphaproteobacteria bacterium]OJV47951.1 MAG: hypothetical protein BGO28_03740 [Alphaproteobacteria bacterium 43-37]